MKHFWKNVWIPCPMFVSLYKLRCMEKIKLRNMLRDERNEKRWRKRSKMRENMWVAAYDPKKLKKSWQMRPGDFK